MSLIVNGTTIPTNVANSLMVNGVSVTSVMVNGINAWLQSLVTGPTIGWSGNSIATGTYGAIGINVSGFYWRQYVFSTGYGGWITTNADGTFSGNSNSYFSITTSGSNITLGTGWVTYNPINKQFSSSTYGSPSWDIEHFLTSGGLIASRYVEFIDAYGPWVSLT